MSQVAKPVTIAVPGDLNLTTNDQPNYAVAMTVVKEINELVLPDFVQFIGDNVQNAKESQFRLFRELTETINVPFFTLVGDHDIEGDLQAVGFRAWLGETYGQLVLRGFRFVRLNTLDASPMGFSDSQLEWLQSQFEAARENRERLVIFQHHYPYKVCESFAGPGIDRWFALIDLYRPTAIICGHTHYGQIANNGRNVSVTTRSIGDPEGGPPGFLVIHFEDDDFALRYRTIDETGPLVLITHPRDSLLAIDSRHIVASDDQVRVRIWSNSTPMTATARIDEGSAFKLSHLEEQLWAGKLDCTRLQKGSHEVQVDVQCENGRKGSGRIRFVFDPTGRFTGIPGVRPAVQTTSFC